MTTDAVREALRQKLRDRWSEYSAEVLERPAAEVLNVLTRSPPPDSVTTSSLKS